LFCLPAKIPLFRRSHATPPFLFLGSIWLLYKLLYCPRPDGTVWDLHLSTLNNGYRSCSLAIISTITTFLLV
jgi:hypothetical protein